MSSTQRPEDPRLFINSLRNHVLDPIRRAVDIAEADRSELVAEQDAFREFIRRVDKLEPEPAAASRQLAISDTGSRSDEARAIYEETVLAVDHYQTIYDESLGENAIAELGTDAAEVLSADTDVHLTPVVKNLLINRAQQRVEERTSVIASIATEQESLERHLEMMRGLVDGLTGTVVPKWYQERFEAEISRVLSRRQEYLHRHRDGRDRHELCMYLYKDRDWRYPVLTSVTRLCEATVANPHSALG